MKTKLSICLVCSVFCLTCNAFTIDYDAINDDDNPNNFGTNTLNYAVEGYYHEDESVVHVHHDKQKGVMQNQSSDGLVLEGVNKNDLENLYYGNELYKNTK